MKSVLKILKVYIDPERENLKQYRYSLKVDKQNLSCRRMTEKVWLSGHCVNSFKNRK